MAISNIFRLLSGHIFKAFSSVIFLYQFYLQYRGFTEIPGLSRIEVLKKISKIAAFPLIFIILTVLAFF